MSWVDWRGGRFVLREEWAYVNGPASPKEMQAGVRDAKVAGRTPSGFLAIVNEFIRSRRVMQQYTSMARRGDELSSDAPEDDAASAADASLLLLPEDAAYLTLDEVIASGGFRWLPMASGRPSSRSMRIHAPSTAPCYIPRRPFHKALLPSASERRRVGYTRACRSSLFASTWARLLTAS